MKIGFEEGEIITVVYGVVSACIGYDGLGLRVGVELGNVFVGENGDIVLSDAGLYANSDQLFRNKNITASDNMKRISDIA